MASKITGDSQTSFIPAQKGDTSPDDINASHNGRPVRATDTSPQSSKAGNATSNLAVGKRRVQSLSPDNLDRIKTLAEQGQWGGVRVAMLSCTTQSQLDEALASIDSQVSTMPKETQQAIGKHFEDLWVKETADILTTGLTS